MRSILIQCARAPIKSDERMKEFYLRIKRKRGERKAIVAVARKLLVNIRWVFRQG
ncbi:MAG: hypothetical protein JRM78_03465 [Nitrososphaerota archaeon]|nr:hypothetical protein [Nitrososphaerota archaeon]